MPTAALKLKDLKEPVVNGNVKLPDIQLAVQIKEEKMEWLNTVMAALEKEKLESGYWKSQSAYHARIQQTSILQLD